MFLLAFSKERALTTAGERKIFMFLKLPTDFSYFEIKIVLFVFLLSWA